MGSLLYNGKALGWCWHPAVFLGGGQEGFCLLPDTWSIPRDAARWEMAAQPGSIAAGLRALPRAYSGFKGRSESH